MKVFAGLVGAAMATLTIDDCPNSAWELNADSTKCVPKASKITVTCSASTMKVEFHEDLIYVELDASHSGEPTSSVNTIDDSCTAVTSNSGTYDFDIDLDACGTTVAQSGGKITFSNTIVGNVAALTIDGIVTTESLELDVSCEFDDNFELTVDDISVEAADHDIAGSDSTGAFDSVFSLTSYTDVGFSTVSSAVNAVVIGKPVYNRVLVTNLPSNVDFVVTDCTAQDAKTNPTSTYKVIQDGCLDTLLGVAAISTNLEGDASGSVDFRFNGFTFDSTSDTVYLTCDIALCARDASGALLDANCGVSYIDGACTDTDSTLGYTKA